MSKRSWLGVGLACLPMACASNDEDIAAVSRWQYRGAWLAPRSGHPLDSDGASKVLQDMRRLGVRQVAVGHDVNMPKFKEPRLTWGEGDEALRRCLRRVRKAGLEAFLLPRIESPDFFKPPFPAPFRGDIRFDSQAEWDRFHEDMELMILHYARLAEQERVSLFGLGLELKHSVREHPGRWRQIIAKVRKVYSGKLTYSANWYQEWEHVTFWDALDLIGIGAYFELKPGDPKTAPGSASRAELLDRWAPVRKRLRQVARKYDRPVLFTEIGYTGYRDCAEKPWEWSGKAGKGIPIDHAAQARAFGALFDMVRVEPVMAGLFSWRFYTTTGDIADWEYSLQGRPAERVLSEAYRRPAADDEPRDDRPPGKKPR